MPSGLILTVLASQHFRGNERDDVSLANTSQAIYNVVGLSNFLSV